MSAAIPWCTLARVHVIAEVSINAIILHRAKRGAAIASFSCDGNNCAVHERSRFLDAKRLVRADHDNGEAGHDVAPKRVG